jgi:hypothetical protein
VKELRIVECGLVLFALRSRYAKQSRSEAASQSSIAESFPTARTEGVSPSTGSYIRGQDGRDTRGRDARDTRLRAELQALFLGHLLCERTVQTMQGFSGHGAFHMSLAERTKDFPARSSGETSTVFTVVGAFLRGGADA